MEMMKATGSQSSAKETKASRCDHHPDALHRLKAITAVEDISSVLV